MLPSNYVNSVLTKDLRRGAQNYLGQRKALLGQMPLVHTARGALDNRQVRWDYNHSARLWLSTTCFFQGRLPLGRVVWGSASKREWGTYNTINNTNQGKPEENQETLVWVSIKTEPWSKTYKCQGSPEVCPDHLPGALFSVYHSFCAEWFEHSANGTGKLELPILPVCLRLTSPLCSHWHLIWRLPCFGGRPPSQGTGLAWSWRKLPPTSDNWQSASFNL